MERIKTLSMSLSLIKLYSRRMKEITRRGFIKSSTALTAGMSLYPGIARGSAIESGKVKIGVVGTGNRGISLLKNILSLNNAAVVALCDLDVNRAINAASLCEKRGRAKPRIYGGTLSAYKEMLDKEQLDASYHCNILGFTYTHRTQCDEQRHISGY